jgi:hydrogenase-4 component B
VVFLGAPRSKMAAQAHECGPAMRGAMLVLAGACVVIGLAPVLFWPALACAIGAWRPAWAGTLTPEPLFALGWVNVTLALAAAAAAWWLWRLVQRNGLKRGLTWDCGYVVPTARMQYTAGSFAGIITEWFQLILRSVRHEHLPVSPFPTAASFESHTPETVLELVIEPVGGGVMKVSTAVRRFQHGRVQSYLLYLLLGVVALAAVVLRGGGE